MVDIKLNGKVAIITGAASGLGKATALRFAEAGADVVAADINLEGAQETANEINKMGRKSLAFKIDTREYETFQNMIKETSEKLGKVDSLVNCAGIGIMKPIVNMTKDDINNVVDINLKGTIFGCKAALEYMVPRKSGKIVNFSSIAAKMATPDCNVYASTKAGVISLTAALAREVADSNININAVLPGIIRTKMWEEQLVTFAGDDKKAQEQVFAEYGKLIPLGRPQEPIDVANMVLFLCSDLANNITAQNIAVDGGSTF